MSVSSIQDTQNVLPKAEVEKLREAARSAERWDVILRPNAGGSFAPRVAAARADLAKLGMEPARDRHALFALLKITGGKRRQVGHGRADAQVRDQA